MNISKRDLDKGPKKICPYANTCYRQNPVHFEEFSHPHLENIVLKGRNSNDEYAIPADLRTDKAKILNQLRLVEKFSKVDRSQAPAPKKLKADSKTPVVSEADTQPLPGSSKNLSPQSNDVTILIDSDDEASTSTQLTTPVKRDVKPSTSANVAIPGRSSETQSRTPKAVPKQKVDDRPLIANDLTTVQRKIEDYIDVVYPKGEAIKKYEASHPYNFFLTAVVASPKTHSEPLSITLQEILDESLGTLESSVQINFMVDIGWLLGHYYFAGHDQKPMLILYGDDTPELVKISSVRKNVTAFRVEMSSPFATHHAKVMLLGYNDRSMRVVISTANLYEDDWRNRTQGIWISPRCYEMDNIPNASAGESVTGFRRDLIRYLNAYNQPRLQEWTARIQKSNFEAIKVFLVTSVPGSHQTMSNEPKWGHLRLGHLLAQHSAPIDDSCPLIAQSSSIGSLGKNVNDWIFGDIGVSLARDSGAARLKRTPAFKMIFPTYSDVKSGHDGILSGGCLPYRRDNHMKQTWLENHLQIWKSNKRHRTQAIPHIKTYCRYSSTNMGLYWFCLSSANLSKAAWGSVNKGSKLGQVLRIMNYEVGVLFLPKFIIDRNQFPLEEGSDNIPSFPMPYDLPLTPYTINDAPFFYDYLLKM